MEVIATLGAAMGGSSAAATVGTAAAAGTSSAALLAAPAASAAGFSAAATTGAGFSLSTLSSGLTLASGALSLFGGNQQAEAALVNAEQTAAALTLKTQEERLAARQEEIAAKQSGNEVLDRLNRTLAAQRLAYSANGVDGDFGSANAVAETAVGAAGRDLSLNRLDANMRILARRRQAGEYLRQRSAVLQQGSAEASGLRMSGVTGAVDAGSEYYERRIRRG